MAAWHAGGQEFESPWLHWVFTKWVSPNREKARARMLWPFCFALNPPVRAQRPDLSGAGSASRDRQKICHINGFPHQISVPWGYGQTPPHAE